MGAVAELLLLERLHPQQGAATEVMEQPLQSLVHRLLMLAVVAVEVISVLPQLQVAQVVQVAEVLVEAA